MAKFSLVAGFKDPVRRPRYLIWTGVVVLMMAAVVIVALGVTSTYWFCANGCHKVQDDTITAYNNSSHSKISCMACHMPVNADPITFVLHKAEALGELYLTATNKFEIPLNGTSHVAMNFDPHNCTQCHSENRVITPGPGIIIDHAIHEENEVTCTMCHNRVAHNEDDIEFVNIDPATDELNAGHDNFMSMTACFRCHGLTSDADAPGACAKCHPAGFELKPASHLAGDFYPGGHAEMAIEAAEAVEKAASEGHGEEGAEEGNEETGTPEESEEGTEGETSMLGIDKAFASGGASDNPWVEAVPAVGAVNYCSTCHVMDQFCTNCHGMEMPHPTEFKEETHPAVAAEKMDKCDLCHQVVETNFAFCNECHHGAKSGDWAYDPKVEWQTQHAKAVTANGVEVCLEACHETKFCSDCHTKLKPIPTSHKAGDWLRKGAEEIGVHADAFTTQPKACEVCHGPGMPNNNKFCTGCHVLEMPHPQDFKEFHSKTGKDRPAVCANCHTFKELCSDCHHEGAKNGTPWKQVHGAIVNDAGAGACFEKCHQDRNFCVKCHTSLKVVPASHNQKGWTQRAALDKPAAHQVTYKEQEESCTYCHGEGGPEAKFCQSCHGLAMPHPDGYGAEGKGNGGVHQAGLADKSLSKATCTNCHVNEFCGGCHHGYTSTKQRWVNYHPTTVREDGSAGCFECHEETYCSYCHVREASKYIDN